MRARRSRRFAVTALAGHRITAAGCSNSSTTAGGQDAASTASSGSPSALKGVCPDTVVFQTNWWPQDEYGGLYRMVGANPTVDSNKNKVTGTLVDNGTDTGVKIEIRSGGPANNFTPSTSLLYTDKSIMFGGADLDQVAQVSGSGKPVLSVFAPLDLSPVMLLWDPAQHPEFNTIADIGQTDTKVIYFQGATYMAYLPRGGAAAAGQVAASYDGKPANRGRRGQGRPGRASSPPSSTLPARGPAVEQAGRSTRWCARPATRSTRRRCRSGRRQGGARPCLKKLVPIVQRAQVDFLANPEKTNAFVRDLVKQVQHRLGLLAGRAAYAIDKAMSTDSSSATAATRPWGTSTPPGCSG